MTDPTVRLESIGIPHAIKMVWEHDVLESDITQAFDALFDMLDTASQPLSIVVDLTRDPQFPLIETMMGALPSYRHRQMSTWLVVGSNTFARYISRFLGTATKRANVQWFDTEAEALDYLVHTPIG